MRRVIAIILPIAALLSGCGTATIKESGAEKSITDVVVSKTGIHPQNVKCPSGVEAKVGKSFDCHFTGPGGTKYTAHMKITKIHGDTVDFYIQTAVS